MTATDIDTLAADLADNPAFLAMVAVKVRERPQRFINDAGRDINALAGTPVGHVTVSPGQTISSASWGNPVWNQSVNCFASVTDRDAQWATPPDGAVCYTVDAAALWIRKAGVWRGLPSGTLAQVSTTTNSASTSTNVDWITAPPITADGTRRVKITFNTLGNTSTANDLFRLNLMEGSTVLQYAQAKLVIAGGGGQAGVVGVWQGVPAAGSHTYKLNVNLATGVGPVTAIASSTNPSILLVEDIGT
jgi:hypothetical protein